MLPWCSKMLSEQLGWQSKAKQSKAKQSKAKQSKAKGVQKCQMEKGQTADWSDSRGVSDQSQILGMNPGGKRSRRPFWLL
jgi:hypothetical protein